MQHTCLAQPVIVLQFFNFIYWKPHLQLKCNVYCCTDFILIFSLYQNSEAVHTAFLHCYCHTWTQTLRSLSCEMHCAAKCEYFVVGLRLEYIRQTCLTLACTLPTMQSATLSSSKMTISFRKFSKFGTSCLTWRLLFNTKILQQKIQMFTQYVFLYVSLTLKLYTLQLNVFCMGSF